MKRVRILLAMLCLATPLASAGSSFPAQPTATLVAECPEDPLPLSPDAIIEAADAVRKGIPTLYYGLDTRRAIVSGEVASQNIVHGILAKQQCGEIVWHRTVVVYVGLPKAKEVSRSQWVVFVSRLKEGWRVWGVLQIPVREGESARPAPPKGPAVDVDGCPENPLPLPPDAVARATQAALRAARTLYRGINARGAIVESAALAPADQRGRQVRLIAPVT